MWFYDRVKFEMKNRKSYIVARSKENKLFYDNQISHYLQILLSFTINYCQSQKTAQNLWPAAQIHLHFTNYKNMQSAIQLLIIKYPALQYFNILETVTEEELQQITPQLSLPFSQMTPSSKTIFRKIRQYASAAQQKFKHCRNLYRTLKEGTQALESIILDNSNLKSLQALQNKVFHSLSELQLSSNEIRSISPLRKTKTVKMQYVDLNSNHIQRLQPLNQIQWPKLKYLLLSHNNISSIQGISFRSFLALKNLDLSDNFITEVRGLRKELHRQMKMLKQINLQSNEITDLSWLSECYFYQLEKLNLRNNRYPSFSCLQRTRMEQRSSHSDRIYNSGYEILTSYIGNMSKYIFGYRIASSHKLSIKAEKHVERIKRQNIQKSRRLILF